MTKTAAAIRRQIATDTREECVDAAYYGACHAVDGDTEDACPYGHDTAQGIIWLQAFRLTTDRMNDAVEA
jgi:hypothetical protein